jgi:hypothetical protein
MRSLKTSEEPMISSNGDRLHRIHFKCLGGAGEKGDVLRIFRPSHSKPHEGLLREAERRDGSGERSREAKAQES